jgi:hypothetical protein
MRKSTRLGVFPYLELAQPWFYEWIVAHDMPNMAIIYSPEEKTLFTER